MVSVQCLENFTSYIDAREFVILFSQGHTERDEGLPATCELQGIYKQTERPFSGGRHKEENRVGI